MTGNDDRGTIVFPHIPKCGGTTVVRALDETDLKVFVDNERPPSDRPHPARACQRRNEDFALLDFSPFDVIIGHFPLERYRRAGFRCVTLLRHPVDRVVSLYCYWKNDLQMKNAGADSRIVSRIRSGEMDFLKLVRRVKRNPPFERFLQGARPRDFALVGFTDAMPVFIDRFSELVGRDLPTKAHYLKSTKEPLAPAALEKAAFLLADEIALYEAFRGYWR